MDFYHSDEPKLWKGYLLIAIDGSKAEVPNSKENRETEEEQYHCKLCEGKQLSKERCLLKIHTQPGNVVHTFNPSTKEAEAGRFLSSRPDWSTK